jgi:mRNA export factor
LDSCFSADGYTVFSCGTDKAVRMWRLGETPPNNLATQIGAHDAPVKAVRFIQSSNLVVSGGWDRKVREKCRICGLCDPRSIFST